MRSLILAAALLTAAVPAYAQGAPKYSTATSTIGDMLKDPAAKAVLEKTMGPIMQYADQLGGSTLKQLQGMAGGQITDDQLAKVDAELAKIK